MSAPPISGVYETLSSSAFSNAAYRDGTPAPLDGTPRHSTWPRVVAPYATAAAGLTTLMLVWRALSHASTSPKLIPRSGAGHSEEDCVAGVVRDGREPRVLRAAPPDLAHYEQLGMPFGAHGWTRTFGLLANPTWSTAADLDEEEEAATADTEASAPLTRHAKLAVRDATSHTPAVSVTTNTVLSQTVAALSPMSTSLPSSPSYTSSAQPPITRHEDGEQLEAVPMGTHVKATASPPLDTHAHHEQSSTSRPPRGNRWQWLQRTLQRLVRGPALPHDTAAARTRPEHRSPANITDENSCVITELTEAHQACGDAAQQSSSIVVYAPLLPGSQPFTQHGSNSLSRSLTTGASGGVSGGGACGWPHVNHGFRSSTAVAEAPSASAASSAQGGRVMSSQLLQKHISYLVGSAALVRDVEELVTSTLDDTMESTAHALSGRVERHGTATHVATGGGGGAEEVVRVGADSRSARWDRSPRPTPTQKVGSDSEASAHADTEVTASVAPPRLGTDATPSSEPFASVSSAWAPSSASSMPESIRARGQTDTALHHCARASQGSVPTNCPEADWPARTTSSSLPSERVGERGSAAVLACTSAQLLSSVSGAAPAAGARLSTAEQLAILENRRERQWHMTQERTRQHGSSEVIEGAGTVGEAANIHHQHHHHPRRTSSPPSLAVAVAAGRTQSDSTQEMVPPPTSTSRRALADSPTLTPASFPRPTASSSQRNSETLLAASQQDPTGQLLASSMAAPTGVPSQSAGTAVVPPTPSSTSASAVLVATPTPPAAANPGDNHDRRVDDLRVKHQDGNGHYSISLTYHDAMTGSSRTIDARALPKLQPQNAPPVMMNGSLMPSPTPPLSSLPGVSSTASVTSVSSEAMRPRAGTGASQNNVLRDKSLTGVTPRALRTSRASSTCASSVVATSAGPTAAAAARHASSTTTASSRGPFGAPLPSTEPTHGPRLQGVAGRRGEMVIGAFLGGGACGKVYECLNTETNQLVAAKQLVFDAKDTKLRQRLRQLELELEVLTLSAHHSVEHIVGFHGAEKRGHSVLMYLEYCANGSLLDYMADGKSKDASVWGGLGTNVPPAPEPSLTQHAISAASCVAAHPRHTLHNKAPAEDEEAAGEDEGKSCAKGAAHPTTATLVGTDSSESTGSASSGDDALLLAAGAQATSATTTTAAAAPVRRDRVLLHEEDSDAVVQVNERGFTATAPDKVGQSVSPLRSVASHGSLAEMNGVGSVRREARLPLSPSHASPSPYAAAPLTLLEKARPSTPAADTTTTSCSSTCASETVSEMLRPQMPPLSIDEVQRFTREILLGLQFMHAHKYAHLDIKTANILITADEACRVADLGCAMRLSAADEGTVGAGEKGADPRPSYPVLKEHNTITELRGTALYMAPEMIRFERSRIGSPADIWSVGCVVMEMSTGSAPWRHLSRDKLRVLFRVGSAREDLPLPPLMQTWAAEAEERLGQLDMDTATMNNGPGVLSFPLDDPGAASAVWEEAPSLDHSSATRSAMAGHKMPRQATIDFQSSSTDEADLLTPVSALPYSRRRVECEGEVTATVPPPQFSSSNTTAFANASSSSMCAVLPGTIPITPGGFLAEYVADPQRRNGAHLTHAATASCSNSTMSPSAAAAAAMNGSSPECSLASTALPLLCGVSGARVPEDSTTASPPVPTAPTAPGSPLFMNRSYTVTTATEQYEAHQRRTLRLYIELERFVACCLHVSPEDRWSAEELLQHPFLTL